MFKINVRVILFNVEHYLKGKSNSGKDLVIKFIVDICDIFKVL